MVRPQRVEYEGAYYHVMNRGQGRQNVYHGERYYEYFLDCLEQAHKLAPGSLENTRNSAHHDKHCAFPDHDLSLIHI